METDIRRFFEDDEFECKVNLTQEEGKFLGEFETNYEYQNGFRGISGGFACMTLEEFDEEDDNIIIGYLKSGIQSDCENVVYTDIIIFNRTAKTIVFD